MDQSDLEERKERREENPCTYDHTIPTGAFFSIFQFFSLSIQHTNREEFSHLQWSFGFFLYPLFCLWHSAFHGVFLLGILGLWIYVISLARFPFSFLLLLLGRGRGRGLCIYGDEEEVYKES